MAEMLATTGSAEIAEWIAEFVLRDREEQEAMKSAAEPSRPRVLGG